MTTVYRSKHRVFREFEHLIQPQVSEEENLRNKFSSENPLIPYHTYPIKGSVNKSRSVADKLINIWDHVTHSVVIVTR